jgi:hypothetical protein
MRWTVVLSTVMLLLATSCAENQEVGSSAENSTSGAAATTRQHEIIWDQKPGYDYDHYDTHLSAALSVENATIIEGQDITFDVRFNCSSGYTWMFNPFFYPNISPPAALAVFDANGTYFGDLLSHGWLPYTGRRIPTEHDCVSVAAKGYVGAHISRMPVVPSLYEESPLQRQLQPGNYTIQMIVYNYFINEPLVGADGLLQNKTWDQHELFRSNPVNIKIVSK